jgi:hypothetical protein
VIERKAPNGVEMSRPASQGKYRAKAKHPAGRVGSIELFGGVPIFATAAREFSPRLWQQRA